MGYQARVLVYMYFLSFNIFFFLLPRESHTATPWLISPAHLPKARPLRRGDSKIYPSSLFSLCKKSVWCIYMNWHLFRKPKMHSAHAIFFRVWRGPTVERRRAWLLNACKRGIEGTEEGNYFDWRCCNAIVPCFPPLPSSFFVHVSLYFYFFVRSFFFWHMNM